MYTGVGTRPRPSKKVEVVTAGGGSAGDDAADSFCRQGMHRTQVGTQANAFTADCTEAADCGTVELSNPQLHNVVDQRPANSVTSNGLLR